jgi:uncharacterized protein (TIGR03067 family)
LRNALISMLLAMFWAGPTAAQSEKPAPAATALSSEQVGRMLKDAGFEPTALAPDIWQAVTARDGWKVNIMISLTATGDRLVLESRFAEVPQPEEAPASAWLRVLAENERIGPAYFAFDKADRRIHLYRSIDNVGVSGARLKSLVEQFDATVRKTQHVWRSDNFPQAEALLVAPREIVPAEMKKASEFEGAWKIVRIEAKGESLTADMLAASKPSVVFTGDSAVIKIGQEPERKVRFKLDANQKPKAIDLIDDSGVQAGIYVEETGLLTICYAPVGAERPRQFVTDKKSALRLLVLQRDK